MGKTFATAPPNSLILVLDRGHGVLPDSMNEQLVAATSSCIAVGTTSAYDGDTTLTLTDEAVGTAAGLMKVYEADLHVPSRIISVCSVDNVVLMAMPVDGEDVSVRILANHDAEPDEIVIVTSK